MFHDEDFNDEERRRYHGFYGRMSDAVTVSLRMFVEVLKEVAERANASGSNVHATAAMMMCEFAEAIDGVTVLVRSGSSLTCPLLLRPALEISLGLKYLIENKETYERRALSYEYFHLLDQLKWAQKCDPEHERGKQVR